MTQAEMIEINIFGSKMVKKHNWPVIAFFAVTTAVAVAGAPLYIRRFGISLSEILLFSFFVAATSFAITAGYHRLYAHRAYKTGKLVQFLVLFFGAAAFEQSALTWCSGHRDHHRYVDTEKDPYSIKKGFWYAHIGWMTLWQQFPDYNNVKDLLRNKLVRHQYDHYVAWGAVAGILFPILLGAMTGHALGALIFSVCLRLTVVYHGTFCINSVCHTFGKRTYDNRSTARDHWLVALFTNGEGYHNFHHRFPTDYRNGVRWYQWDPSKWLITLLGRTGLAWELRSTEPVKISEAKAAADRERTLLKKRTSTKNSTARIATLFLLAVMTADPSRAAVERLSLPEGDPERGREAFVQFKCTVCHEVRGDNAMEKPVAGLPGPKLGVGQSRYKADFLADSIVFPSHAIVPGATKPGSSKGVSRMGDFSDTMTVRELADIVAYLKSLDEEV